MAVPGLDPGISPAIHVLPHFKGVRCSEAARRGELAFADDGGAVSLNPTPNRPDPMTDLLAHDVLRGAVSPFRRSPRGLDRVDLDISGHLHKHWPGEMVGVLALPWGLRYFDRARIAAGRDAILRDWAETPAHDAENTGGILRSLLTQPQPTIAGSDRYHNNMIGTLRVARLLWGDRPRWGGSVYDLPAKSLYLDTGQMPTIEGFFGHFDRVARWLADRPDIRFVSKVHDIMPLSDPAFYTPDAASRHRRWLDLLAARGHGAIVSTSISSPSRPASS